VIGWRTAAALARKLGNGQKKSFHLLGLTILNSYILYKSCGKNMTHLKFREQLVRKFIVLSHKDNIQICGVSRGQPSSSQIQMSSLEVKHSLRCQLKEKRNTLVCAK
jgi:hypothetical protein